MNTNQRDHSSSIPGPDAFEITDEKFKELFEQYRKMIEDSSIGTPAVAPTLSLHFRQLEDGMPGDVESVLIVVDTNFNEPDEKTAIMQKIGEKCFEKKWILVAACMSSEAWASMGSKDNPPDMNLPPRKDPNRKEVIVIAGRTLMGECKIGCMIPVKRDSENKFLKDGDNMISSHIETFLLDNIFEGFTRAVRKSLKIK